MYPSVRAAILPAFKKLEGYLPFMYLDVKGLVTTGMGNLIDPVGTALNLPWKHTDGSLAAPEEISSAWNTVKSRTDLKMRGGGAFAGLTNIHLDDDGIQQLIDGKLDANESLLMNRFPGYSAWPADAQLALHSMAWAMGPAFNFPKFQAAVNQLVPDFDTCAVESHMNDAGNPGLTPRNAMNYQLFKNAANAIRNQSPFDQLQYNVGQVLTTAANVASQAVGSAATSVQSNAGKTILVVSALAGAGYWLWNKKGKKGK
jgi:hypothetical protein